MDFIRKNKSKRKRDSSVKVVYISSPMKVKTSASRFRTLVQELTGRDSDISRFMDSTDATPTTGFEIIPDDFRVSSKTINENNHHLSSSFPSVDRHWESPTSSESFLEGVFPSNLFCDSSELDVLGSYDAL